jgi:hypothetical protein
MIFSYCLVSDGPIVDPVVVDRAPPQGDVVPKTGSKILQTCRRVYHETDRRPLIAENTFRFTTVARIRSFFQSIGKELGGHVQNIEIDARKVHTDHSKVGRQWSSYLASGGLTLGSLREDAPRLKCLRLNFESWPSIPMVRTELWNLLRNMLLHVEGLERIVVVGASKGKRMAMREPWSPLHFVGGDAVGSDELVPCMWNTVKKSDSSEKIVRWERRGGRLYLEVVSKAYLLKHVDSKWAGPCTRESPADPWPENGTCTWFGYLNRHVDVTEGKMKEINPSAAG